MDRLIYIAMTGASQTLNQQSTVAHNLANVATPGFRAQTTALRATPVFGQGLASRAFVVDSTPGSDLRAGPVQHTGRDLDVAVQGQGWIAVQAKDGTEAYTRNGSLMVDLNGALLTRTGLPVLGDGGPITLPADAKITIGKDGTVSALPAGQAASTIVTAGRIKLVNPPEDQLTRGADGLFRVKGGNVEADARVTLADSSLEGSNVNVAETMVQMISLARQFELQMKLLQNAESDAQKASQLLNLNG
ncbi:MAG: flagellar basal-body rod protein FlgF [Betaproteobacteria bacterium]|nr:flagellar basal-body rod protein FlgF [Betaproteobacteria bacterium]